MTCTLQDALHFCNKENILFGISVTTLSSQAEPNLKLSAAPPWTPLEELKGFENAIFES